MTTVVNSCEAVDRPNGRALNRYDWVFRDMVVSILEVYDVTIHLSIRNSLCFIVSPFEFPCLFNVLSVLRSSIGLHLFGFGTRNNLLKKARDV